MRRDGVITLGTAHRSCGKAGARPCCKGNGDTVGVSLTYSFAGVEPVSSMNSSLPRTVS